MKYTDPDGRVAQFLVGAITGAIIGAVSSIVIQTAVNTVQNGGDIKSGFSNIDWKSVGTSALSGAISGAITGGASSVSTIYKTSTIAKAVVNASANVAGTTVGTVVDNAVHGEELSKNLGRNNTIAAVAGVTSGCISGAIGSNGSKVIQDGKMSVAWVDSGFETTGKVTPLSFNTPPASVSANEFIKDVAVGGTQEIVNGLAKQFED